MYGLFLFSALLLFLSPLVWAGISLQHSGFLQRRRGILVCFIGYIFFIWDTKDGIFASWCRAAAAEHLRCGKVWDANKRAVSGSHFNILTGKLALICHSPEGQWVTFLGFPRYSGSSWLAIRILQKEGLLTTLAQLYNVGWVGGLGFCHFQAEVTGLWLWKALHWQVKSGATVIGVRKPDRRLEAFISSTWAFGATRTKSYHTKRELLLPEGGQEFLQL